MSLSKGNNWAAYRVDRLKTGVDIGRERKFTLREIFCLRETHKMN